MIILSNIKCSRIRVSLLLNSNPFMFTVGEMSAPNYIVLYSGRLCKGDEFKLYPGEYVSEETRSGNIVAIVDGIEEKLPYSSVIKNFKKGGIHAIKLQPKMKAMIYENIDKKGRWIVFENADTTPLEINNLDMDMYNFGGKVEKVIVEDLPSSDQKYQSKYIVNPVSETFNIRSIHHIDSSLRKNIQTISIIILSILALAFFIAPFLSDRVRSQIKSSQLYNPTFNE